MISAPVQQVTFVKLSDIAKELWSTVDVSFGDSAHTLISAGRLITPLEDMVGTPAVRELTTFCRENLNLLVDLES